jgi:RNA polymerase sigma-70 factor (sigma-E family)
MDHAGEAATAVRGPQPAAPSFEQWLAARGPALQRTAHLLTGDAHAAQDLVQTTLAKLYMAWPRISRKGSVDAYARRVLVNEHRSNWRRSVSRRELATAIVPEVAVADPEYDGLHDVVWAFVCSLPPRQRAVVVLRFYEQLTEAEIADLMDISIGTVKSQSSRALAALRQRLPGHPELGRPEEDL